MLNYQRVYNLKHSWVELGSCGAVPGADEHGEWGNGSTSGVLFQWRTTTSTMKLLRFVDVHAPKVS